MIIAFTGQPGAGKSVGAISFVLKDKQFVNRPVYAYGFKGLNVEGWTVITKEQVLKWWELPDGSVIMIDECQDIMRPRKQGVTPPEHIEKMEKHRHSGIDIVLTFQFPTQIDMVVRQLITDHYHCHRPMGLNVNTVYHWDGLCIDPMSKTKQVSATKKTGAFDKDVFDLFDSASMHTAKPKFPKILFVAVPALLLLAFCVYHLSSKGYETYKKYRGDQATVQLDDIKGASASAKKRSADEPLTEQQELIKYLKRYVPRLPGEPRSAPIYDQLNEAKSLPRKHCVSTNVIRDGQRKCKCYSQQATWLRSVDNNQCLAFIRDGATFDHTLEDRTRDREGEQRGSGASRAPFDLVQPQSRRISVPRREPQILYNPNGL